ncbi:MAG: dihydroorotate dehydrogenase electron transfer subunit [Actinobacteria bacterium]|nr:dihydroorotate dehydrogenase electron transfer subunit [Actinomycetota bacterium]
MKLLNSEILSNQQYGPGIFKMELFSPYIVRNVMAGQFVNIRCAPNDGTDPLLRRPFSVFDIEERFNVFSVLYMVKGKGTGYMSSLRKGDTVDLAGPMGSGIDLNTGSKDILLIGGGMGIAPLNLIAKMALARGKNVFIMAGFRDSSLLRWERDLVRMEVKYRIFSEDGKWGEKGLVSEYIFEGDRFYKKHEIYVCGPVEMLKIIQEKLGRYQISATALLEEKMACGIGVCMGCVVKIRGKNGSFSYKRVCREGPAFELSEVVFE